MQGVEVKFGKPRQASARTRSCPPSTCTRQPCDEPHMRNAAFLSRDLQRVEGVAGNDLSRRVLECSKQRGEDILSKVNKFSRFAQAKKQKAFVSKHQFQWKKEQCALKDEATKYERAVVSALQQVPADETAAHCNTGNGAETVAGLQRLGYELRQDLLGDRQQLLGEVKELRSMVRASCSGEEESFERHEAVTARQCELNAKLKAGNFGLNMEERQYEQELAEDVLIVERMQLEAEAAALEHEQPHAEPGILGVVATQGENEEDQCKIQGIVDHYEEKLLRADMERAQTIQLAREHFAESCGKVGLNEDAYYTETGGWESSTHTRFVNIYKAYVADKKGRKEILERLGLELRTVPRQELAAHHEWMSQRSFLRKKLKAAQLAMEQQKHAVMAEAESAVNTARQCSQELRAHEEQVAKFEAERHKTHLALQKQRQEAKHLAVEASQVAEAARRQREKQEEAAQAKRVAYLAKQKKALQGHQRLQDAEAARRREEARRWQLEMEQQMQKRRAQNKARVGVRSGMQQAKIQQARDARTAAETEAREREKRLERLREQVRVIAEEDLERTRGKTVSSAQTQDHAKQQVLFKNDGFDIKQLMSDNRFRLATVLSEGGVGLGGAYAHQMMMKNVPKPSVTKSSIQL
eukprot:TRINITY_DN2552_c0_g2_i1.p1 TRINITY_DN2552_c0_g2~~TRINITY_DN2552_c0_g2_i1.p1  ORF type:complete len:640 (+),score=195.27 TRINITY_DN2552_c0_g2_i1:55-1974(+)